MGLSSEELRADSKNNDSALMRGLDYEEIRNLVNRYFDAAWRQHPEDFADTYAENGEFTMRGMSIDKDGKGAADSPLVAPLHFKGRAAIREMAARTLHATGPLPFGHNHVIELVGPDRASGTIMVELLNGHDFTLSTMAYYKDDYIKIEGQWKLLRREMQAMAPGMHPSK